jgi:hypothetical protein
MSYFFNSSLIFNSITGGLGFFESNPNIENFFFVNDDDGQNQKKPPLPGIFKHLPIDEKPK